MLVFQIRQPSNGHCHLSMPPVPLYPAFTARARDRGHCKHAMIIWRRLKQPHDNPTLAPAPAPLFLSRSLSVETVGDQVKYFPRVATEYLKHFAATPNLVPFLKVRWNLDFQVGGLPFWASSPSSSSSTIIIRRGGVLKCRNRSRHLVDVCMTSRLKA